ncbi:hypothetical protein O2K51_00720 [Apibacter raozihei]|uniref:hypothetical protein n=1 Tax=Apibacter raozihei TaxID=2500547 RepID=UPI000FE3AECD|nr:hypothetical protein [Apibacter raozihei]
MNIKKFNSIDINNFFLPDEYSIKSDFNYGEIDGYAKIIGYQIIFFFVENIEALCIEDVVDVPILLNKSNEILEYLSIEQKIGDKFFYSEYLNNEYQYKDSILDNITRYYYLRNKFLIIIGINKNSILESVEIIKNEIIIKDRIESLI